MDDGEHTLLIIRECYVYKIPPRVSSGAPRCQDWGDLNSWLCKTKLLIVGKGELCTIRLEDQNTGELFAACPVNGPEAYEGVSDSSRYFVLRIDDGQGRHAFIGIGFRERGEAFDFNCTLQDFKKHVQQEKEFAKKALEPQGPSKDYSLKSGQTITVNLKNVKPKDTKPKPAGASTGILLPPPSSGGKRLAPPPRTGGPVAAPAPAGQAAPASGGNTFDDMWGEFTAAPSNQGQAQANPMQGGMAPQGGMNMNQQFGQMNQGGMNQFGQPAQPQQGNNNNFGNLLM